MKKHNFVKNLSVNSLIASMNTRKILTVTLCILMLATVFPVAVPTTVYAQTPTPPQPDPKGNVLTPEQKKNVDMALKVLKLTRPTEVGNGEPGSNDLTDKLNQGKIRSETKENLGKDAGGMGYSNDASGEYGGLILIEEGLLNDPNLPGEPEPPLTTVRNLLELGTPEFVALVGLAEMLLHEYVHTQQSQKQQDASDEYFKFCWPDFIEMEAYWACILYKLDLKLQLLAVANPSSLADRAKLDALDSMILGDLTAIEQPRQVVGLEEPKTYEGWGNEGKARQALGKIEIGPGTEPEDQDKVQQRRDAAKDEKDNAMKGRETIGPGIDQKRKESQREQIDPGTGGSIELPSGSAWVVVPPGSLPAPAEVEIHWMDLIGLPRGTNALSPVYELGPGQISLDPAKPARLYIRIDNPALIKDAHLCRWDTYLFGLGYDGWQEILDGRDVDEHHGVISVEVDHFSYYMVIATTEVLYGSAGLELITIDTKTGTGSLVGSFGTKYSVWGLEYDPKSDILYGVTNDVVNVWNDSQLLKIDRATGVATPIGGLVGSRVEGLAYNSINDKLYGVDDPGDNLVVIDTSTGAGTVIGSTGFPSLEGLAFNPLDGKLYSVDVGSGKLIRIDPSTGIGTAVALIDPSKAQIRGLSFNRSGTLYGVWNPSDRNPTRLVTITTSAGQVTDVGSTGYFGVEGLAFAYAHDVAVTKVTPSKTVVGQGYSLNINVTVANQGYTEIFNVTLYANTTSIATQTVTLTSENSATITFTWNTAGFAKGKYTISAYAWPVQGETDKTDNTYTDGTIQVTIKGDVNADGKVDLRDLVMVAKAYGTKPGQPRWNPNADINSDGKVDLHDLVTVIINYGKKDP